MEDHAHHTKTSELQHHPIMIGLCTCKWIGVLEWVTVTPNRLRESSPLGICRGHVPLPWLFKEGKTDIVQ